MRTYTALLTTTVVPSRELKTEGEVVLTMAVVKATPGTTWSSKIWARHAAQ